MNDKELAEKCRLTDEEVVEEITDDTGRVIRTITRSKEQDKELALTQKEIDAAITEAQTNAIIKAIEGVSSNDH